MNVKRFGIAPNWLIMRLQTRPPRRPTSPKSTNASTFTRVVFTAGGFGGDFVFAHRASSSAAQVRRRPDCESQSDAQNRQARKPIRNKARCGWNQRLAAGELKPRGAADSPRCFESSTRIISIEAQRHDGEVIAAQAQARAKQRPDQPNNPASHRRPAINAAMAKIDLRRHSQIRRVA